MLQPVIEKTPIGVIIGRFQNYDLHEGHISLINDVCSRHKKVLILVGIKPGVLVTRKNPLDFYTRKLMIQDKFPGVVILPLHDMPSDSDWSKSVDEKILETFGDHQSATLYGSRDAFIPFYSGKFATVELENTIEISSTEIRESASDDVRSSSDFRRGVCYAAYNRHPVAYPTVDIVIFNNTRTSIVLGRKKNDLYGRLRFPGGFFDPSKDNDFFSAAKREAIEETGLEVGELQYIGSTIIDDWRYRGEQDKIITTIISCKSLFGSPTAGDDLFSAGWYPIDTNTRGLLLDQHKKIFDMIPVPGMFAMAKGNN